MPDSTKPLLEPMLNDHLWSSPGIPESNFTVSDQVIMLHNMFEIYTFKIAATSVRGPMNWYGIKGKTSTVIVWFGYMAVLNNQWFSLAVILNCPVKCLMKPGTRLTKVYEVTKDIATHLHKLKTVKHIFCGVWFQNCVWNFICALWNFTHNFEPTHCKICILRDFKNLTTYDILQLWYFKS